jgi:1,4-alpha-glucan branching enzyme
VIADDAVNSVFAYERSAGREPLLVIVNMTPVPRHAYRVGAAREGTWREILNTDAAAYGGGNLGNGGNVTTEPVPAHGHGQSLALLLPPLAALVLRYEG